MEEPQQRENTTPGSVSRTGALLALMAVAAGGRDGPVPEWRAWQHAEVKRLEKEGVERMALRPIVQAIHEETERRRDQLEGDPVARACTENLRAFSRALSLPSQPGHTMGLEPSDQRYFATLPYPDLLELPLELRDQRFLKLLDENTPRALDAAAAFVDDLNAGTAEPDRRWRCFVYQSQHLATPDGTNAYGRFFVYVPGPSFDRYLQFGLRDDPQNPLPHGISMVAIQKTQPDTGAKLPVARAFFQDFWRTRENGVISISTRLAQTGHLESCHTCHKRALLPIVPAPSTFDAGRWGRTLEEINTRMQSHGASLHAGLDGEAYGPGLGPLDSPLRTDAFLRSCAGDRVRSEDFPRFKRAMGCVRCHDGAMEARLDHPILLSELPAGGNLVSRFVVTYRKMPPGVELTDGEREALVHCLEEEYYRGFGGQPGLLAAWLLQPDCLPET